MSAYDRAVSFEDVDAAGIVFFARYFSYCHEAMERFFGGVPGGYLGLITKRRIGFPTVHLETDFAAPLRYGDVARISLFVMKVGTTSCAFRYEIVRAADDLMVATITQVVVSSNLDTMTKVPLPPDCRALLTGKA